MFAVGGWLDPSGRRLPLCCCRRRRASGWPPWLRHAGFHWLRRSRSTVVRRPRRAVLPGGSCSPAKSERLHDTTGSPMQRPAGHWSLPPSISFGRPDGTSVSIQYRHPNVEVRAHHRFDTRCPRAAPPRWSTIRHRLSCKRRSVCQVVVGDETRRRRPRNDLEDARLLVAGKVWDLARPGSAPEWGSGGSSGCCSSRQRFSARNSANAGVVQRRPRRWHRAKFLKINKPFDAGVSGSALQNRGL